VRAAGRIFCYVLLALSCVLFVLSLLNECYFFERPGEKNSGSGLLLLLIGWLGVFQGIFAWLTNPLLLVGWFLLVGRLPRAAAVWAFAGTVCAGSFLFSGITSGLKNKLFLLVKVLTTAGTPTELSAHDQSKGGDTLNVILLMMPVKAYGSLAL
jgi:hypothetical protein